jgi:CDP-diacylglycerol--glycerol-3-phosphate 3-phosphatidyltransferase
VKAQSLIVNAITFFRVPLILAWFVLAVVHEYCGGFWAGFSAVLAMFFSGLSDLFDGMLARKWRVVSSLGKMADPLMDKVFYAVAFPALVWLLARQGECEAHTLLMLLFTILYLVRDMWVTFMRSVGTMFGADVAAMWLGKVRTALSFPCAGWTYMYLAFHTAVPETYRPAWLASCLIFELSLIALTVVSLFTYTRSYLPYLKKALERK